MNSIYLILLIIGAVVGLLWDLRGGFGIVSLALILKALALL